ncbi:MAG: glycosyltransferase [bacterium]|jgi:glycosyltransferase involved in cell wall biosynthesis|nr:glycosyltransferase [bacterium]
MKRVLIITYYWPPAGGPGVQRVLKFAKYLPGYGWEPLILTVKDGEYPARDVSLLDEVPQNLPLFRTRTREPFTLYKKWTGKSGEAIPVAVLAQKKPGLRNALAAYVRMNLFIPDAKKGWIPFALREGSRIIEQYRPELIFSSSPPPTVHLIAKKLSARSGIPWIADLRDPWSNIHYYKDRRSACAQRLDARLERRTLGKAAKITTVSRHFASLILSDPADTHIIPNGFDEHDFAFPYAAPSGNAVFTIAYIGGLNENRFYPEFFHDLGDFITEQGIRREEIRLILAGQIQENLRKRIAAQLDKILTLDCRGYLHHADAVSLMCTSGLLLLFMEKVSDYKGHIPGKLFEYLRSGKYILGLGEPDGEVSRILNEESAGKVLAPGAGSKAILKELYLQWKAKELRGADRGGIIKYSREKLTQILSEVFNSV